MSFIINNIDVTNDLIEGSFSFTDRCDTGLAQGRCELYTNLIAKNIPPYTLCTIDGVKYFISSIATKDMQNEGFWHHDCTILELTAILQCYILGVKYFSVSGNHTDLDKIHHIVEIVYSKYLSANLTFIIHSNLDIMTDNHEFNFGSGTTMLQALTEIMTWYNLRPKVTEFQYYSTYYLITIDGLPLDGSVPYTLDSNRLISNVYSQSVDNYGAIIESDMQNVVDRTNTTTFKGLTSRCESPQFNDDEAFIKLPCRVEEIKSFYITDGGLNTARIHFDSATIQYLRGNYQTIVSAPIFTGIHIGSLSGSSISYVIKTFDEWCNDSNFTYPKTMNGAITLHLSFAEHIWTSFFKQYYEKCEEDFRNQKWVLWTSGDGSNPDDLWFAPVSKNYPSRSEGYFDPLVDLEFNSFAYFNISNKIVERKKWGTIETSDQPKYAVYDTGGDKIYNLNGSYRKDLWGIIFGQDTGNIFQELNDGSNSITYNGTINGDSTFTYTITYKYLARESSSRYYLFDVDCIPMANMTYMDFNDMSGTPINETKQKILAKSYNASGQSLSFDNIVDNMKKNNMMLGQPEISIEYDTTDLVSLPQVTNKITIDDYDYYVISFTKKYSKSYNVTTLNLCLDYSKIADALGVESQYQSTRLPIDSVIERPIVIYKTDVIRKQDIENKDLFLWFYFDGDNTREYYIRPAIYIAGGKICFYCEFEDNYSAGKNIPELATAQSITSGNFEAYDVPYGDSKNECGYVYIALDNKKVDIHQSYILPKYDATILGANRDVIKLFTNGSYYVHKDAREKLTFTIICNYTESE